MNRLSLIAFLGFVLVGCGDDSTSPGGGGSGQGGDQPGGSSDGGQSQGGESQGGESQGGGGAASGPVTAEEICEGRTAWEEMCSPDDAITMKECLADPELSCFLESFREDVQRPLLECLYERPCAESDDGCYESVGQANPVEGQEEYIDACMVKFDECHTFSNDFCAFTILEAQAYTELSACLEGDCDAAETCLNGVFEALCPSG
ncbi:MAG: hypothetical protein HOW73_50745 [Polyangiaceae bacterium]|nr:hypothetical protein [Polyangiaceae bacterium]